MRICWVELLLRRGASSVFSSTPFLEKKELFDAVIGVVGVFGICREGGGLRFRSGRHCSWRAAILAAVGVLRGPTVMGGRRNGWRFFFCCDEFPFLSISRACAPCVVFLTLSLRCTLAGSGAGGIEILPVELL